MSQKKTEGNITLLPINRDTYIDRMMVDTPAEEVPECGLFRLSFNNKRRQGRSGLQTRYCLGTLYESGHVHLDTNELPVNNFDTLTEMQEYLEQFGSFHIHWFRGE
jgi:hypothetical protein